MFRHLIDVKLYLTYVDTSSDQIYDFTLEKFYQVIFDANEQQTGRATLLQVRNKYKLTFEIMRINTSSRQMDL